MANLDYITKRQFKLYNQVVKHKLSASHYSGYSLIYGCATAACTADAVGTILEYQDQLSSLEHLVFSLFLAVGFGVGCYSSYRKYRRATHEIKKLEENPAYKRLME